MRKRYQRGFTLVELTVTMFVGSILSTTFFSIMYWQNMQYYEQLDKMDAHQNARAALNIMRRYVRSARFGLAQDANATGAVPIGMCMNTATQYSQYKCNNVDPNNNDRLRVEFLNFDPNTFVQNPNYPVGGNCDGLSTASPPIQIIGTQANPNLPTGAYVGYLAGVGGKCSDGNGAGPANDLVWVTGDSGSGAGCAHRYSFIVADGTFNSQSKLTCNYPGASGVGANSGFTFGPATIADFYVTQDANNGPALMLRTDPRSGSAAGSPNAYVVAYGVEQLQVTYGIDLLNPAAVSGRTAGVWTRDLATAANGGTAAFSDSQGNVLTQQQIYNRIVAVRLQIKVRTDAPRKGLAGSSDGYRHFTYSTTIALRNDSIL